MPFLDVTKKKYIIDDVELPVKEANDISMDDYRKLRSIEKAMNDPSISQAEANKLDDEFYEFITKTAFDMTWDELLDKIRQPDARALIGEVYVFLTRYGTIDKATLLSIYSQKMKKQESEPEKKIQN